MRSGIEEILHFLTKITFQIRLEANAQFPVTGVAWHKPDTRPYINECCKGAFKRLIKKHLIKNRLPSAKAEACIQIWGTKGLMLMSIKLWLQYVGCSPTHSSSHVPHIPQGFCCTSGQGDAAACIMQARHSTHTAAQLFVMRMGQASGPEGCASAAPQQDLPGTGSHTGNKSTSRKEVAAPPAHLDKASSGQLMALK